MNKMTISFFIVLLFLLLSSCKSNNAEDALKTGTYIMVQSEKEEVFSPRLTISEEDMIFSYDPLSSYLPIGAYTIEDNALTMKTDDNRYHYVFRIDRDRLIFQEEESSSVKLIDDRLGVKITDGAVFQWEASSYEVIESNNDIFTEEILSQVLEIDYWYADTKLVINNEADIRSFYNNLASLKLTEPGPLDADKMGHQIIDLVLENRTISIGLLSGEVIVDGKKYDTDKDICDAVRTIALKYEDYYKNDVFTEDLYEQLTEIDCFVEEEKLVIEDVERLEEVYHYLSRLTLEDASPDYEMIAEPMKIDLITKDTTISLKVTSNVVSVDDKVYYTDSKRDLMQLITTIARESQ